VLSSKSGDMVNGYSISSMEEEQRVPTKDLVGCLLLQDDYDICWKLSLQSSVGIGWFVQHVMFEAERLTS
jgi:hypothetical protein